MLYRRLEDYFNSDINTALVFNVNFNGLGVIRSLSKEGIPVIALDCSNNSLGRYTRFASFYKVPNPKIQESEFIKNLIVLGKNFKKKPVLFPTNDIWSIPISKYKKDIKKYFLTYNPSYKVIDIIINKKKFYSWCKKKNFNIPNVYAFKDINSLEDKYFPLIIKPLAREMSSDSLINKQKSEEYNKNRLITIANKKNIDAILENLNESEYILQEKIIGDSSGMYAVGIYADRGSNVVGLFCGKKIRGYPYEFGDCIVGESLYIKELVDLSIVLIKELNYTGIAEIEYKKDIITGEYKLIEVNPRTWSWIGITPYAGVNLPFIAYNDLVYNVKPRSIIRSKGKVIWIRVVDDIINNLFLYGKKDRISLFYLFKEYRKYSKRIFMETCERDIRVLLAYIFIKFKSLTGKAFKRIKNLRRFKL